MGRYDEAVSEFEYVLKAAPDNLTAVRELADVQERRRARTQAPPHEDDPVAEAPSPLDPVIAELEAWLAVIAEERDARVAGV